MTSPLHTSLKRMPPVTVGLDRLLSEQLADLRGKRVGLLTNSAGVSHLPDRQLQANFLALRAAGVKLVALFSPEHGLAGAAADGQPVAPGREPRTGLPIHSLYGSILKPTAEMLRGIDVLLYDMQDVGVRFYTYTVTLAYALEACAAQQLPLVVLDRPNPIGGVTLEGPLLDPALQSFVGHGPLRLRYGMTLGELAHYYNRALRINASLAVVSMRGWRRELWYDQTGLQWIQTSPAMPHLSTATLYPGMCLLEGTNVSEGRGTALPFELVGAPWVDGYALASALNALRLPGARFRPCTFTPASGKFMHEECFGVQAHVTERDALRPVSMALYLIATLRQMYPAQFAWHGEHFDRLIGDVGVRSQIEASNSVASITSNWEQTTAGFAAARDAALLYPS